MYWKSPLAKRLHNLITIFFTCILGCPLDLLQRLTTFNFCNTFYQRASVQIFTWLSIRLEILLQGEVAKGVNYYPAKVGE